MGAITPDKRKEGKNDKKRTRPIDCSGGNCV